MNSIFEENSYLPNFVQIGPKFTLNDIMNHKNWRRQMPTQTPKCFQKSLFSSKNIADVMFFPNPIPKNF